MKERLEAVPDAFLMYFCLPMVSVIIPFFNAEQTLDSAVKSILSQTYDNFELLLVNNASTDKSGELAKRWAEKDARIKVLFEEKQGVVYAHNRGWQEAKGQYIARMDADDVALPHRLEKQVSYLEENPEVGLVSGRIKHVDGQPDGRGISHFVDWVNEVHSTNDIALKRFVETPIINPSILCRREVMEEQGSYEDGDFPEDYELWLRYLDKGVNLAKVDDYVLEWKDSDDRLTRTDDRYAVSAFYAIKTEYLAKWLRQNGHDHVWVWGAGRVSRRRSDLLLDYGISIQGYIDLTPKKEGQLDYLHFEEIPKPGKLFILSYVANRGAREEIQKFLITRGYVEGIDFMLVS